MPTLVQNTSSRGPGVVGSVLSARSFASGCASGSVFTPVGPRVPKMRAAALAGAAASATAASLASAARPQLTAAS